MSGRVCMSLLAALVFLAGCLESNPQPAPLGGKDSGGGNYTGDSGVPTSLDEVVEGADAWKQGELPPPGDMIALDVSDIQVDLVPEVWDVEAGDTVGELEAGALPDLGTDLGIDPAELAECMAMYSGCGCEMGCADGFWSVVFYPEGAGEFPEDFSPPAELLEVALAMYDCSICTCEEGWQLKQDGEWVGTDPEGFCTFLLLHQAECDGCLTTWQGGCC